MLFDIARRVRASAHHLATAQRHLGAASRLEGEASRLGPRDALRAASLRAEAARLRKLGDAAMARHTRARRARCLGGAAMHSTKTRLVYRYEHAETGAGAYCAGAGLWGCGSNDHPTPEEDQKLRCTVSAIALRMGLLKRIGLFDDMAEDIPDTADLVFGFASLAQDKHWFRDNGHKQAICNGVILRAYRVPSAAVVIGHRQCVFLRTAARCVAEHHGSRIGRGVTRH